MGKLTKQAAKQANAILDQVAQMVVANADHYEISPEIADKFAHQCDLLSDHIARKAGVNVAKLAHLRRQGLSGDDVYNEGAHGFDPEEIGEEDSGPIQQEPDEPYMEDHFTQQENRELREKTEAGELLDGSPERQTPRPGVQANLEVSARLADLYSNVAKAANLYSKSDNPDVQKMAAKFVSAGNTLLDFNRRLAHGQASLHQANVVLTAAQHILPHLGREIPPNGVPALTRMASILNATMNHKSK